MRPASFATTVGSTGAGRDGRDVVIAHEPEVGATLRTRGRFYLLCEVDPPSRGGAEAAAEVSEIARQDYYYDLSAGIEVSLRRALRKANRHAAQIVREQRGKLRLHVACAVVVGNELHAARIGGAQVFLVRHARLFLPGEAPDELADFVHRTTTRQAASLGAEPDLLPMVWRQTIDPGDTIILASGSVVSALGAEALKNAAITLHPRAAAEHVRSLAIAEGVAGSHATVFIEVAPATGAAARVAPRPEVMREPEEVAIAENIRSRVDAVSRRMPSPAGIMRTIASPIATIAARALGVILELMPRRRTPLPRRPESARQRSARGQRVTSLLAVLLLVVTGAIAYAVIRDYEAGQVVSAYQLAIVEVEQAIVGARAFTTRNDSDHAWERLTFASDRLDAASRSPAADATRVTQLREEIRSLEARLERVLIDLSKTAGGAAPSDLTQTVNGLYAADPGAGRLWRIYGDPVTTGSVLRRGANGVGSPAAVTADGEALLTIDDARKLWRAQGDQVAEVELPGSEKWKGVTGIATFSGNFYLLDAPSGQLWRYEPDFHGVFQAPTPFLPEPLAADAARAVAVDGDIWILTSGGEVQRYRRQGAAPVLTKLPFEVRWLSTPLHATHLQALESQRSIYLLDSAAQVVAQVTRDGREIARFDLPSRLPAATAFFVSEGQRLAYTVHGSKISTTDMSR